MRRMLMSLLVATIAAACSAEVVTPPPVGGGNVQGPAPAPAPAEPLLLRSGDLQQLRIGQKFGVALTVHPSVGYSWELADMPDMLRAEGVTDPDFSDVAPGGDVGDKIFRFVAAHPGGGTLRFVHIFRGERREEVTYRFVVVG